jgi:predicted nucleic acid-binding protein
MNVLVDTSVWSLAFRRTATHLSAKERLFVVELGELIKEGRARIIGLVRQEFLSGIRTTGQYERLRTAMREFPDEIVNTYDHEAAARAANECRARGVAVSVTDILICEIALSRGFAILTVDPDFRNYAKVLPIRLHEPRK